VLCTLNFVLLLETKYKAPSTKYNKSPPVIRGVARFDSYKSATTGGANFVVRDQFAFDNRAIFS
jgi:hypothetical protein